MRTTRALASFSIGGVLLLAFILGQALGLPEVEDPIPDKIGLGYLIAFAGAGGVLGGIAKFGASPRKRERAVSLGSFVGFCIAAGTYVLLLLIQIVSNL
ncbi:MAG TPA: hypothetical protein VFY69_04795 [Solirubrobacterales bacterium]|nr:hypothetical protein [Solirubrobacterales bacterium]